MNYKGNKLFRSVMHAVLTLLSVSCVIPFALLFISSFTDDLMINRHGYSFFPRGLSLSAYEYLWTQAGYIFQAYGITVFITAAGTSAGLLISSLLAYPLSRRDYPLYRKQAFFVFFTLLFNGGLVPTYLLYTQILDIKNTILALLVPGLLVNGFNILLMRTYFMTNIPSAVLESAQIDGSGEFRTFFFIVLPLSLPILATVGLLQGITYWNDWYNGFIYITNPNLFSLQNVLNKILMDIQFLTSNSSMGAQAGEQLAKIPTATVRMAMAVIGVLPIMAAYPFFQRYFVKGIVLGAVKG